MEQIFGSLFFGLNSIYIISYSRASTTMYGNWNNNKVLLTFKTSYLHWLQNENIPNILLLILKAAAKTYINKIFAYNSLLCDTNFVVYWNFFTFSFSINENFELQAYNVFDAHEKTWIWNLLRALTGQSDSFFKHPLYPTLSVVNFVFKKTNFLFVPLHSFLMLDLKYTLCLRP